MSPEERQILTSLFDRVRTASSTPRDREAEVFIEQASREQPYATYYLAQAVVVQEKGLEAAANRIKELEEHVRQLEAGESEHHRAEQGGGFLNSIFGSSQPQQPGPAPPSGPWNTAPRQTYRTNRDSDDGYRAAPSQPTFPGPWAQQASAPAAGGSFLRGALGTAAGVAGGMLLANSLSGIFGHHMSSLGWGSPFEGANPFGNAPAEETTVNNYFGDDAIREASDSRGGAGAADNSGDALQQADYSNDDLADDQPDFDNSDLSDDSSMDV
jgi:hypothetical protein